MRSLGAEVASNPHWYHTIELAAGVVTPGQVDMRALAPRLLPDHLRDRRALDVGTFDGFWAFEMERRGADVVAIDVAAIERAEWPPANRARLEERVREWGVVLGRGFEIAARALDSGVRRVTCDVYDLTPEAIGGPVDFAFCGAVLVHLRDPVGALERLAGVLAPGGELLLLEPVAVAETFLHPRRPVARFEPPVTDFNWWRPNAAALRAWLEAAGLGEVQRIGRLHSPPARREMRSRYLALSARRPA